MEGARLGIFSAAVLATELDLRYWRNWILVCGVVDMRILDT